MRRHASGCLDWVIPLVAAVVVAGCGDSGTGIWEAGVRYPTGVEYHESTNRLLVGSYHDGSVGEIALDGRPPYPPLLAPYQDGRRSVLRIRLDAARDRLWLLDVNRLYVYGISTRQLIHQAALPEWTHALYNCLPDIAIDRSGAALVSSNLEPTLWRVDAETFRITRHDLGLDADLGKDFGFSGLAFAMDGEVLLAASANLGSLWRIDLENATARKIQLSSPIRGACALAPDEDPRRPGRAPIVYVAAGFRNGLLRVHLSSDLSRGHVTGLAMGAAAETPVGIAIAGPLLLLASSQLSRHPNYSGNGAPSVPFRIIPVRRPQ